MARVNVAARVAAPPIHEPGASHVLPPRDALRRVLSCALLGERQFYVGAEDIEATLRDLAARVPVQEVAAMAVVARQELGLRHAPLLLLTAMAARRDCGPLLREAAAAILRTPRDAMDLVALYWARGRAPLPHAFKRAIADGFARWSDYQIAKYATLDKVAVRLRDLLFLAHAKPAAGREALFTALADGTLRAPDTWESLLSVPGADKRTVWEGLLRDGRLGALALVRNLRNMEEVGVDPALVRAALAQAKAWDVWPWQALAAARQAPAYTHDLDALVLRSAGALPRLPGRTLVLVDVSASMDDTLSGRGSMKRMDAAAGLAVVLREICEAIEIATFSNECVRLQAPLPRGARLARQITENQPHAGTALGQAIDGMTAPRVTLPVMMPGFLARWSLMARFVEVRPAIERLVVLTDEQSQDRVAYPAMPVFVINLASTQRGIAWDGPVVRLNGWSGGVVRWLAEQVTGIAPATESEEA